MQFGVGVIVVKLSDSPASELAAAQIASALFSSQETAAQDGGGSQAQLALIDLPRLVLLSTAHGEGRLVLKALKRLRAEQKLRGTFPRGASSKFSHVVLQEFAPGVTLKDLCHGEAEAAADPSEDEDTQQRRSWASRHLTHHDEPRGEREDSSRSKVLFGLGSIIAYDVLTCNADRIFLEGVFSNFSRCGNLANILLQSSGGSATGDRVVALDNATGAYDTSGGRDLRRRAENAARFREYQQSVFALCASVTARLAEAAESGAPHRTPPHPSIAGLRRFFLEGQGVPSEASFVPGVEFDIGEAGLHQIESGFQAVVERLQALDRVDSGGICQLFGHIERNVKLSCGIESAADERACFDLVRVNADFLTDTAHAMLAGAAAESTPGYDLQRQISSPVIEPDAEPDTEPLPPIFLADQVCTYGSERRGSLTQNIFIQEESSKEQEEEEAQMSWERFSAMTSSLERSFGDRLQM